MIPYCQAKSLYLVNHLSAFLDGHAAVEAHVALIDMKYFICMITTRTIRFKLTVVAERAQPLKQIQGLRVV